MAFVEESAFHVLSWPESTNNLKINKYAPKLSLNADLVSTLTLTLGDDVPDKPSLAHVSVFGTESGVDVVSACARFVNGI